MALVNGRCPVQGHLPSDPSSEPGGFLESVWSHVSRHPSGIVGLTITRNYRRFLLAVLLGDPRG